MVGVAELLSAFDFAFERSGPLAYRYDLTLNLEGSTLCTCRPRAAAEPEAGAGAGVGT